MFIMESAYRRPQRDSRCSANGFPVTCGSRSSMLMKAGDGLVAVLVTSKSRFASLGSSLAFPITNSWKVVGNDYYKFLTLSIICTLVLLRRSESAAEVAPHGYRLTGRGGPRSLSR
jgi:hypothetical protein